MSTLNQSAPPAAAANTDFVSLEAFPEDGSTVLTVTAFNFTKDYVNTKQDGTTEVFDALEFYLGAVTSAGPRFIKTWPARYSIHEKANYGKLYKAAKGTLPAAGSNPKDLLGLGVLADLVNEEKVSKKGKKYMLTGIKGLAAVHPKLKGDIVPLATLLPALEIALKPKDKNAPAGPADAKDGDVPF